MLGQAWAEAYNRAPIWRFWLGSDFCGEATIGAFMPSVDGVGRPFPLTVFAVEVQNSVPPPEIDSNEFVVRGRRGNSASRSRAWRAAGGDRG